MAEAEVTWPVLDFYREEIWIARGHGCDDVGAPYVRQFATNDASGDDTPLFSAGLSEETRVAR